MFDSDSVVCLVAVRCLTVILLCVWFSVRCLTVILLCVWFSVRCLTVDKAVAGFEGTDSNSERNSSE